MSLSPATSPLAPGSQPHPVGSADGLHHPPGLPAKLRPCRTATVGEGMTSAGVISMPSSLVLLSLLLPDVHICELFSTLLVATNFLAAERKLRFLCDFEKKYQFSKL